MKTTTEEKKLPKKFHLSEDDINNLKGRDKFRGYILDLIQRDMQVYIYTIVLPKFGIKDKPVKLSDDFEWIEIDEQPVILKPNGKTN